MRLGLVTDVHSHAAELSRALVRFRQLGVDQVVTIGDTIDSFARSEGGAEVATLLLEAGAVGVWGNHDFMLRGEISEKVRARFPQQVFDFMERMQPRLVIEDCHFSHKEASVDPFDVEQLWDVSETRLELDARVRFGLEAAPQRLQFVGHYHRWWAATQTGTVVWKGGESLAFDPQERYFVIVAAVCDGWCALLDTKYATLEPLWCGA